MNYPGHIRYVFCVYTLYERYYISVHTILETLILLISKIHSLTRVYTSSAYFLLCIVLVATLTEAYNSKPTVTVNNNSAYYYSRVL